ncbi:DUF4192 domain-containing protein [Mycobacterium sp. NPDC050041]|uniref:DUF4192 domain-containing protein n=1 Tax=Mycobacterium sp. NPDC050041 TaxID=3364293 RepID=UPI003C2AFB4F
MTSSQQFGYRLNHPGRLIAAVPAVLGFVPEQSLVLVTVHHGDLGGVLRVDLSDGLAASIDDLARVAAAAAPDAVVAVIVDECGADCEPCNDAHRELVDRLDAALAEHGIDLLDAHVVDRVAAGGRWHSVDGRAGGPVDDPSASPLAAAAVLDGRRLYRSRAELEAVLDPEPARSEELIEMIRSRAQDRRAPRPDAVLRSEIEDTIAAARRLGDGRRPDDTQMAAMACALTDPSVRDTLYALAIGQDADLAEALWVLLSRTLPPPWRNEALVLLAFSAYARGDGPLAGVALEAALRLDPRHRMAGMLDQALRSGMRPDQIRELALTGYRMADRLGVRLPPRTGVRRRSG